MKKLAFLALALAAVFSASAQGTFNGNTTIAGGSRLVLDVDGLTKVTGDAAGKYTYGQWYVSTVNNPATMTAVGSAVAFKPAGAQAGYFTPGVIAVNGIAGGTQVYLQLRAWQSGNTVTSFEAAKAAGNIAFGQSTVFAFTLATPPAPASTIPSFTGFALAVPEPSTIALGVMGLGALLLRRRK